MVLGKSKKPTPKRPEGVRRLASGTLTDFTGIWAEKKKSKEKLFSVVIEGQALSPEEKRAKNKALMEDLQQRLKASKAYSEARTRKPNVQTQNDAARAVESEVAPREALSSTSTALPVVPEPPKLTISGPTPPSSSPAAKGVPRDASGAAFPTPVVSLCPPDVVVPPSPIFLQGSQDPSADEVLAFSATSAAAALGPPEPPVPAVAAPATQPAHSQVTEMNTLPIKAKGGEANASPQSSVQFWKGKQKMNTQEGAGNVQENKPGVGTVSPLRLFWERVNMKPAKRDAIKVSKVGGALSPSKKKPESPISNAEGSQTLRGATSACESPTPSVEYRGRSMSATKDDPARYKQWCSMMESGAPGDSPGIEDPWESKIESKLS